MTVTLNACKGAFWEPVYCIGSWSLNEKCMAMYSEDVRLDLGGLEPPLNRWHWGSRFLCAGAGWWLTDLRFVYSKLRCRE